MRKAFLTVLMVVATIFSANAEKINFASLAPNNTQATNASAENMVSSFNLVFYSFDGGENYGFSDYFLNPNGLGGEFNIRANFESHGNYNFDLAVNYTFEILKKDDLNLYLVLAAGPSIRLQDEAEINSKGKIEWNEKVKFDGIINPRLSVTYKNFMLSGGFFYWAPEFKFGDDAITGFNIALGYSF